MNHPVSSRQTGRLSAQARQQVLDLRRAHSLSQVATLTGLPLGTVKTICSRSGVFRDNQMHREMFTLPPIKLSANTGVSIPELPPQQVVTGDKEIDAVLWLHQVIKLGQPALIEKAMLAAAKIKTPLEVLEKRYTALMIKANPGNFIAAFASIGFADLKGKAEAAVLKLARTREAHARFGDDVMALTPAEQFCEEVLAGVGTEKNGWQLDVNQVDSIFSRLPTLLPHTLADCLHELAYWDDLYRLRYAAVECEHSMESRARDDFAFRRLALIRPRAPDEAVDVFRHLAENGKMDRTETSAILLNLLGARGGAELLRK